MRSFERCALAAALFVSAAVHAQEPVATRKFMIRIGGPDCRTIKEVFIVVKGKEKSAAPAERAGDCLWSGTLAEDVSAISASETLASLRLGIARTECRYSVERPDPKDPDGAIAYWAFDYNPQTVVNLRVQTQPESIPVTYVRKVPRMSDGSHDCVEGATYFGKANIHVVHFATESLSLQLGRNRADLQAPGLFVDDPAFSKHGRNPGTARATRIVGAPVAAPQEDKAEVTFRFTPNSVVAALAEQRARGKLRTPPTLSPAARDAELAQLRSKGLESLLVTVTR